MYKLSLSVLYIIVLNLHMKEQGSTCVCHRQYVETFTVSKRGCAAKAFGFRAQHHGDLAPA